MPDHQKQKQEATAIPVSPNTPDTKIDLITLKNEGSFPEAKDILIEYDHSFKTAKKYKAYDLLEVLQPYLEELKLDSSGQSVRMQLWDTAGQEKFISLN